MEHLKQDRRYFLAAAGAVAASPLCAWAAEDSLTKPLKIIVPFSAGALTDIIARLYAEKLSPLLGQPVIVENRPGAGGISASQAILAQPADGHSLLFVSSAHAANPALRKKLPYDTAKDFSGLALLATSPSVIVVPTSHPAQNIEQLIRNGKENPGKLTYGSAGIGSATHLAGEYFRTKAGLQMVHVPYKGVQEAVTAVAAGQLDLAFPPIALAQAMVAAGRIRVMAVTGLQRVAVLPDTPTVAERGFPGFDSSIWYALVAPSASPKPIMQMLAQKIQQISSRADIAEKLRSQGLIQEKLVLGEFDRFITDDMHKLASLVRGSGIQPE
ncbi:tripartite tricarboxylate transporter substrate binding protein [Ottowia thiooxydans]|uniref:Tripartite-type tricarboxylate transporter receptor subunit TctC n=1 Tax=Ottowia thiooxydans TaxID=219182 RepID=A0ABV2Q7B9_9BURK